MSRKVLKRAMCNGRAVKLVHDEDAGDYYVREPGSTEDDDVMSFDTLAEAEEYFAKTVKSWSAEPNWELQAEYDAKWGTDNGYSPWQLNREY